MKKQLKRLKGKRLVTGDANLITKDEILINTTSDGEVYVKEIGTDGKIKDLSSGGGGKEYDDLHTYLYYDDRIVSIGGVEMPLCALIANVMIQLAQILPITNVLVKMSNTEDEFGINYGNYLPLDGFLGGSGDYESIFLLFKAVSIPKYVFPEQIINVSGIIPLEIDKVHIFDLIEAMVGGSEFLKTLPTITREEFFDLLK